MTETQALVDKILQTGKLTKDELDKKVTEKLSSLGGLISEDGALHIIANELGLELNSTPSSEIKLKDVLAGMKNVTVLAKVAKKYELRTFGEDKSGKVANVLIGDETKNMRLTFWNEKTIYFEKMEEGDVLEIQSAYSKENQQGYIEIHMGNNSHCIINPPGKTVELPDRTDNQQSETPSKKLNEIADTDTFVSITATIVQAYDPRFFESCPQCNKRMKQELDKFTCVEHGEQAPAYNYVMNLFLDDSTDNMRASLWKEQINILLEKTEEEMLKLKDDSELMEEAKKDLLGRIITARARVKHNETYNNNELVLYNVNRNPQPELETKAKPATKKEKAKPALEKSTPEEDLSATNVSEELISDDDDELMSIEDIDGDL